MTTSDATTNRPKLRDLQREFARVQRRMLDTNVSLLILIDGWESSGKGRLMRDIVRELDPRYYEVRLIEPPNLEEAQNVLLWRFWKQIPRYGRITVLNRSWYSELLNNPKHSAKEIKRQMEAFEDLEQTLINDDMVVIKFFLHQSKEDMRKNIKLLEADQNTRFFITERDKNQLKKFETFEKHFRNIIDLNESHGYPWDELTSVKKRPDAHLALTTILQKLEAKLASPERDSVNSKRPRHTEKQKQSHPVTELSLDKHLSQEAYDADIDPLQEEAGALLYEMYTKQKAAVLVFEGTDAAGKGGSIRRLVRDMDPRGYDIATTAAPDATERQYHYLWRFMRDMPQDGMLTIFDRSWYGRVLVERIEQFTPTHRWQEAFEEINAFEHHLVDQGRLVLKFLLIIDKDEQKKRFDAREADPDKEHKLTDEDWRNREKFDLYEEAMDEMVTCTSTKEAPWIVIPATDKRYARIEVLKQFIEHANQWLRGN
ncbi:MAG TPA: phosphate:AMP phosphotransferase [Fastidiosipila sp.]|nr:phosphate:AMP phosphotransferase [Fastidiosipila sp.]